MTDNMGASDKSDRAVVNEADKSSSPTASIPCAKLLVASAHGVVGWFRPRPVEQICVCGEGWADEPMKALDMVRGGLLRQFPKARNLSVDFAIIDAPTQSETNGGDE